MENKKREYSSIVADKLLYETREEALKIIQKFYDNMELKNNFFTTLKTVNIISSNRTRINLDNFCIELDINNIDKVIESKNEEEERNYKKDLLFIIINQLLELYTISTYQYNEYIINENKDKPIKSKGKILKELFDKNGEAIYTKFVPVKIEENEETSYNLIAYNIQNNCFHVFNRQYILLGKPENFKLTYLGLIRLLDSPEYLSNFVFENTNDDFDSNLNKVINYIENRNHIEKNINKAITELMINTNQIEKFEVEDIDKYISNDNEGKKYLLEFNKRLLQWYLSLKINKVKETEIYNKMILNNNTNIKNKFIDFIFSINEK